MLIVLCIAGLVPAIARATPLQDGATAYSQGNYAEAMADLLPVANGGDALAQIIVGGMYAKGQGVPEDDVEAVRWFRLSADQGNADGQAALATVYQAGIGVTRDYAEAMRWFQAAAAQGNSSAQDGLGIMYEYGEGVAIDKNAALGWYQLAAAQGDADAAKAVERLTQSNGN